MVLDFIEALGENVVKTDVNKAVYYRYWPIKLKDIKQ